eukprot:1150675-Rhodomonas_salina.1
MMLCSCAAAVAVPLITYPIPCASSGLRKARPQYRPIRFLSTDLSTFECAISVPLSIRHPSTAPYAISVPNHAPC